jgi:general secretion pathway protein N
MSLRTALLLALMVFLATLLVRLPARLVAPLLPASISCDAPQGTLWRGTCGQLRSGALSLTGVHWVLYPLAFARLRVSADILCDDARAPIQAHVELSAGEWNASNVSAQLPLQHGLGLIPSGWSGTLQLMLARARLEHGHLVAITGDVRLLQLQSASLEAALGSYEVRFPAAEDSSGPIVGQLHDLEGPFAVDGQVQLSGADYRLSGTIAAHEGAARSLSQLLQLLGPADAAGRRQFALAGSY